MPASASLQVAGLSGLVFRRQTQAHREGKGSQGTTAKLNFNPCSTTNPLGNTGKVI